MRIANGVEMLEISGNIKGRQSTICPTLLWDDDTVVLVDAGYPGQLPLIRERMDNAGVPFDKLNKVIITHHDVDHIGSLASILQELPNRVEVVAHEEERPYIQGDKRPHKVAQLEDKLNLLPKEMIEIYEMLNAFYQKGTVTVNKTVIDGEELPCCGGITVVYTPGHTLGHICLYLRQSKILIAGDALAVEGEVLVKAPDFATFDVDVYRKSLKKLTEYDIKTIICYHGGLYQDNVNQRIAELADI